MSVLALAAWNESPAAVIALLVMAGLAVICALIAWVLSGKRGRRGTWAFGTLAAMFGLMAVLNFGYVQILSIDKSEVRIVTEELTPPNGEVKDVSLSSHQATMVNSRTGCHIIVSFGDDKYTILNVAGTSKSSADTIKARFATICP